MKKDLEKYRNEGRITIMEALSVLVAVFARAECAMKYASPTIWLDDRSIENGTSNINNVRSVGFNNGRSDAEGSHNSLRGGT